MSDIASAHGRVAALRRHHPNRPDLVGDAQRDLRAATLADHIKRTVDAAPPLTADQRDRLAVLLRGGAAA